VSLELLESSCLFSLNEIWMVLFMMGNHQNQEGVLRPSKDGLSTKVRAKEARAKAAKQQHLCHARKKTIIQSRGSLLLNPLSTMFQCLHQIERSKG
jgi:hypothetical protein